MRLSLGSAHTLLWGKGGFFDMVIVIPLTLECLIFSALLFSRLVNIKHLRELFYQRPFYKIIINHGAFWHLHLLLLSSLKTSKRRMLWNILYALQTWFRALASHLMLSQLLLKPALHQPGNTRWLPHFLVLDWTRKSPDPLWLVRCSLPDTGNCHLVSS